ncbi:MAG TPA: type II toxin-antitoxin system VapC family toxin [Bryobacterales bacterium]|nr:type II toxin-antitoxin system VapC family toxin [Bryobacterales bacterium]
MHEQELPFDELVVDTSVVVKFLVEEPDSDNAEALHRSFVLGAVKLVAPDFLFIEAANALWVMSLRGQLTEIEAQSKITALVSISRHMKVVPAAALVHEAFRTACRYAHAPYDTAFLALAESRRIPLVTADKRFYNKVRVHSSSAVLLRDLPL